MSKEKCGRYHNDYSPRYQPAYDIYEKAREHMKKQKRETRYADTGKDDKNPPDSQHG